MALFIGVVNLCWDDSRKEWGSKLQHHNVLVCLNITQIFWYKVRRFLKCY